MSYIVKRGMISIVMVLALMALLVGTMMDGTSPEIRTYAYDVGDLITESDCLTFTALENDSSVTIKCSEGTLRYKINNGNWTTYTIRTAIPLNNGDSVRFRGKGVEFGHYDHVALTGKVACSGDVASLRLDDDNRFAGLSDNCFSYMFSDCASLTTAPALSATTLASFCYYSMFSGCTSLTTAPELPATTLANFCYINMFSDCTNLETAPALPATTLENSCYRSMFEGCTGLTTAPALPATTLAEGCYSSMFEGCTGLTTAPALPATNLASNCYYSMFRNCTGLTTAPELPATTLTEFCYYSMFQSCTGLTTAPDLPATALAYGCYSYMFKDCDGIDLSDEQDEYYTKVFKLPGTEGEDGSQYAGNMFSGDITTPQLGVTYYIHGEASQALSSGEFYVNGVDVATGTLPDGCSFDADTNTLTLNGANITQCGEDCGIYYKGNSPLNIVLVGDNTIDITSTNGVAGIGAFSLINISGTGKLTVKGKDLGISARNGVNFNSGTVDVEANVLAVHGNEGNITIGNATVTATATGTSQQAIALFGTVINSIAGKGWTDAAGTGDGTVINISDTPQDLTSYKKVQFLAASQTQIDPTYTVTIPSDLTINPVTVEGVTTYKGDAVVSATFENITADKPLNVSVTSLNGFNLKTEDGSSSIPYTLKKGVDPDFTDVTADNNNVLTVTDASGGATSTLTIEVNPEDVYAGTYTDTLTFNISLG